MINTGRWRRSCYTLGAVLNYSCPTLITLFGVIATYPVQSDLQSSSPILFHFYNMVHQNLPYLFLALFVLYLLGLWLKRFGDPWILDKLQFVLDKYQGKAFVKRSRPDPKDYHRVTIFQFKRNVWFPCHWSAKGTWWPYGGGMHPFRSNYLVPVLRSGRLSRKTRAIFYVSDSGDDCEGVAGMAWVTEEAAIATGLPSIGSATRKRDIQEYAESTGSDEALVESILAAKKKAKRESPIPRAIVAIPVERNGKNWGVVVLDSRDPDGIADDAVENYQITIALIGLLLERL